MILTDWLEIGGLEVQVSRALRWYIGENVLHLAGAGQQGVEHQVRRAHRQSLLLAIPGRAWIFGP
jgi:hypothetical protein